MKDNIYSQVLEILEQNDPKKYLVYDDVIVCPNKNAAVALADFFDDLGYVMHVVYEDNDWIIYPD